MPRRRLEKRGHGSLGVVSGLAIAFACSADSEPCDERSGDSSSCTELADAARIAVDAAESVVYQEFCATADALVDRRFHECAGGAPDLYRRFREAGALISIAACLPDKLRRYELGTNVFDESLARTCLDELRSIDCGFAWGKAALESPACARVLKGTKERSAGCERGECAAGLTCDDLPNSPTCTRECVGGSGRHGERCDFFEDSCEPGLGCSIEGYCSPMPDSEGEACPQLRCPTGMYCERRTQLCRLARVDGSTCAAGTIFQGDPCVEGASICRRADDGIRRCRKGSRIGDVCRLGELDCPLLGYCDGSDFGQPTCRPKPILGESCRPDTLSTGEPQYCVGDSVCRDVAEPRCGIPGRLGDPCDPNTCASGLICDGSRCAADPLVTCP